MSTQQRGHSRRREQGEGLSRDKIPKDVELFIFESIDSVELLEVLLLVRSQPEKYWQSLEISAILRTNPESVAKRLVDLKALGLVEAAPDDHSSFRYRPKTAGLDRTVNLLDDVYKVSRYTVLELIFSPMKKARGFASAFVLRDTKQEPAAEEFPVKGDGEEP